MSSWGLGNAIFEITIFTWVFTYEVQKLSFLKLPYSREFSFQKLTVQASCSDKFWNTFSTKQPQCPFGVQCLPLRRGTKCRVCIRKRIFEFQKGLWNMRIFKALKSWNVLSPEGTSARRLQRGPFVFTYVLSPGGSMRVQLNTLSILLV